MNIKDNGTVSIVLPLFNAERFIKKTIETVINQTYPFWELIVVNDCSTDSSVSIVESFKDSRIKILCNKKNNGAAVSRNYGLREAKGKWIAFLDADDQWLPTKLEEQINFMQSNNYVASYTDYRICRNGKWENCIRTAPKTINYRRIINYCYPFTSTVMYRKDAIGLIQIQDLKKNNDYAMWLHLFKKCDGHRLDKCLSYYIKHNDSISSTNKLSLIKHHYLLFKKELKKNSFVSTCLTINNMWHGFWKKIVFKRSVSGGER